MFVLQVTTTILMIVGIPIIPTAIAGPMLLVTAITKRTTIRTDDDDGDNNENEDNDNDTDDNGNCNDDNDDENENNVDDDDNDDDNDETTRTSTIVSTRTMIKATIRMTITTIIMTTKR